MYFYKAYGLIIHSEIQLPELSPSDVATYDLLIKRGEFKLPKISKASVSRRGIRGMFGQDGNLFLHWEGIADYQAIGGHTLVVSGITEDPQILSLFTISEALGLILFQRGYYLLHASSVQVGNEAWCFMGDPGAGKSTTAAAFVKAGCHLISDDLTAIYFDNAGIPFILPAYPQLKIWDNTVSGLDYDRTEMQPVSEGVNKFSFQPDHDFLHDPVKLGAVFFLHRSRNRPALQQLGPSEIPTETLKNFPLPTQLLSEEILNKHFMQSFQCAKSADMWRKRRPADFVQLEKWVLESVAAAYQMTDVRE